MTTKEWKKNWTYSKYMINDAFGKRYKCALVSLNVVSFCATSMIILFFTPISKNLSCFVGYLKCVLQMTNLHIWVFSIEIYIVFLSYMRR